MTSLSLHHFRNYASLKLDAATVPIVLTGPNGAGKTNILEALSFLSPGRGLRGAKLSSIDRQGGSMAWAVSALLDTARGDVRVGTGRDPSVTGEQGKRLVKIDGETTGSHATLAEVMTVLWLTPQMDQLFLEGASARRKFFDRLVYGFHPGHATLVNAYERAMRERSRLLTERRGDPKWLSALERKMAESGIAIAAARLEMEDRLNQTLRMAESAFPRAEVSIAGDAEQILPEMSAVEAEEWLQNRLEKARSEDMYTGRTSIGPHRSDMRVKHNEKKQPAEQCSTGEQKALMLSLVLADARAKKAWNGQTPILLLDEMVAHLDAGRRAALFEEILALGAQAWMTGTDPLLFSSLKGQAQFVRVEDAQVISG
ncbi:MAG: DNA replication/repair protein RecF [Alphaproteobacteria bacterium]|nr:DNA replication/repair protein RecF [Alphaproteobacteria bacterium]